MSAPILVVCCFISLRDCWDGLWALILVVHQAWLGGTGEVSRPVCASFLKVQSGTRGCLVPYWIARILFVLMTGRPWLLPGQLASFMGRTNGVCTVFRIDK